MEKETDLVQQIRQLKGYVILDRAEYEKLVQDCKPINNGIIEALKSQIDLLKQDLDNEKSMRSYWKTRYENCLEALKEKTTSWWRF